MFSRWNANEQQKKPEVPCGANASYWLHLPFRWGRQMLTNGLDILKVLDLTQFRPMPAGLVDLSHPWVTGINPQTEKPIWHDNVIFRSARPASIDLPSDDTILLATGKFLAERMRQSAITRPVGKR